MSTSTVDNSNILGTKTGPQLVSEIATQFGNAKTDLEARPTAAAANTILGQWIFQGASIFETPTGGAVLMMDLLNSNIETGATNAHRLQWFGMADGTAIKCLPQNDGVDQTGAEFGFDFVTNIWFCESDFKIGGNITGGAQTLDMTAFKWGADQIWHAGNFDPTTKAAATHNHSLAALADVNNAAKANTYILEWDSTAGQHKYVPKPSGGGSTNLGIVTTTTTAKVTSDTGTDATIPASTTLKAGVQSSADKIQHDDLVSGAVRDTDFGSDGFCVRTAAGNYGNRTITGATGIKVTNGSGVAANPQISLDTGSDADKVDGFHISKLTQAAYDAIGTPDAATIYFIVG